MQWLWRRYAPMDAAGDEGTTSGGGDTAASGAPAVGTTGAASTDGGGDGAATGTSALSTNADPAATGTAPPDWIPEKYRVTAADGSLDLEASSRKVEAARSELEKKLGSGGAAPKTPEEYTTTVPDAFKDTINLDEDANFKEVRNSLHGLGLTQKQFDGVMNEYWKIAPALVGAGGQLSAESCTAELGKVWSDPAQNKANFRHALVASNKIGSLAGVSMNDIESSGLANNPVFIRMMAAIGPEFGEDANVAGNGAAVLPTEGGVKELMATDAYKDEKHPKHAETVARVRAFFNRQHGNTPVV
jgi:hypothetical protein